MELPRLKALAARVVLASMPTLAIPACAMSYHASYVLPSREGQSCEEVCEGMVGTGLGARIQSVEACVEATNLLPDPNAADAGAPEEREDGWEPPLRERVTVCRVVERSSGGAGRRPEGLAPAELGASEGVARWLAHAAHFEAAAVTAFVRLSRELRVHGAPASLVDGARVAARDEVRHARTMARWRDRVGAAAAEVVVEPARARSLYAMALENAVEGCVGETFGAFVASRQAQLAEDPEFREDLAVIADDELRHAELSWSVHAWAMTRLEAEERSSIEDAMRRVLGELEVDEANPATHWLGLPEPAAHRAMVAVTQEELFA